MRNRLIPLLGSLCMAVTVSHPVAAQLQSAGSDLLVETSIRLSISGSGTESLQLQAVRGEEAISSLYAFQLDLLSPSPLAMDTMLGQPLSVTVALAGGQSRFFNGICSRISQGDVSAAGLHYQAEIVPRLWLLTKRRSSRIFQEKSVPDIVAVVLRDIPGLVFTSRLAATYHPRPFTVQYRETDLEIVSRLMEEEGIFYFFEHGAGGHTMVLADDPNAMGGSLGSFPYRPLNLFPERPGSILSWEKSQQIRSGKVALNDFNFQIPTADLTVGATIQETATAGQVVHHLTAGGAEALEIYDYPGGYAERFDGVDPAGGDRSGDLQGIIPDGARTAAIRAQEEAAAALTIDGASSAVAFTPGQRFAMVRHVDGDGVYVLTGVSHAARAPVNGTGGSYTNRFRALPESIPFRPARATRRPVMAGPQSAVVTGPPGSTIYVDKYGRVKVQFHWDRDGRNDGDSSCWLRVAFPSGSAALPPQVGDEVIVAFLEGDPDQPVIVGSLYRRQPPP